MSDKMTCPACNAHLSSVARAFREGEPCPNCGLPQHAAAEVLAAAARGAGAELQQKYLEAEQRATKAERECAFLRVQLNDIRHVLERKQANF